MAQDHWNRMAKNWKLVGAPLRPGPSDMKLFYEAIKRHKKSFNEPIDSLILGVTPELSQLDWPPETQLYALDASSAMIEALWQGSKNHAYLGSWLDAPFPDGSIDVIVCDGGFGVLDFPGTQRALLMEVKRMLRANGIFIVRLFAPGCLSESVDDIARDLRRGLINTLDVLKFRLWGALQRSVHEGVSPRDVVAQIELISGGMNRLVAEYGFSDQHVATLEYHRHSDARYCLSGIEELSLLIEDIAEMKIAEISYPDHAFGSRCPVVTIAKK